ncbi:unnamed protein product [Miscanthus lutarioriparius]|uniref:Uncharacterized protein n=1 Tax=Miscanthus lutarioriparius TaxID=422564 RepID=A0A811RBV8_9POAL|nr:unnamed protein product [Miscanthus lutarioriparius]
MHISADLARLRERYSRLAEYQSTYAMKLACEKTKDRVAETAAEEMCKMARRGGRRQGGGARAGEGKGVPQGRRGRVGQAGAAWHPVARARREAHGARRGVRASAHQRQNGCGRCLVR